MRMNSKLLTIFLILSFFIAIPSIHAANPFEEDGILGGMEEGVLKTAANIISYDVPIPAAKMYGYDPGEHTSVPLWALFAVFAVVFALLWVISAQLPFFKNDENTGTRKLFVIGLTLLVMFGTPFMLQFVKLIQTFSAVSIVAILVFASYSIYVLVKGGIASGRRDSAKAAQMLANARSDIADAKRQTAQASAVKAATEQAEKNNLNHQVNSIKDLRGDLEDLLKQFQQIKYGKKWYQRSTSDKRMIKLLTKIQSDAGRIITFQTKNDRLWSGMSTSNFDPKLKGNLTDMSGKKIKIKKSIDTETNDLASIISGMMKLVSNVAGNIDKLIELTTNAINICHRMERDIVLEEQMVDKI